MLFYLKQPYCLWIIPAIELQNHLVDDRFIRQWLFQCSIGYSYLKEST